MIDLPPKLYSTEYVELTTAQKKQYRDIKNGIVADMENILASVNPLNCTLRLRQLTSGNPNLTDDSPKLDRIKEMLEEEIIPNGHKAIIFSQWSTIAKDLGIELSEYDPIVITGEVPPEQRQRLVDNFQTNPHCKVAIGTIGAMGTGLTLNKTKNEIRVAKNHKDRLFRMIFREKKELLSLYNAVNGTSYTNAEDLEIVTLENAIYMNMKNDLAFIMDSYLNLYEHQSTYSPNMPLRDLFYIAKELQGQIDHRDLYRNTLIKIPTPRFLVFYNGSEEQAEKKYLRLSDAFQKSMDAPDLELVVTMLNINLGKNRKLLEQCQTLKEYAIYVKKVRTYAKSMKVEEAVDRAVTECINEGILQEFLLQNRKEAVEMSIFEYDEEAVFEIVRKDEYEKGHQEGVIAGKAEDILELLEDIGTIPEEVREKITGEIDLEILKKWHKLAAKSESIDEFVSKM